jgi:hypothetical protein
MAMDMYTLYGEAVASFLLHGALVFIAATIATPFKGVAFYIVFAAAMAGGSFIINGGLLTVLHQLTCSGVKNVSGILKGAGVSAVLAVVMSALPYFIEPLRLVVSQMVMPHRYLAIPARIEAEETLKAAATRVHELGGSTTVAPDVPTPLAGEGVGSLPAEDYAVQTFQEARVAASYLAAFAGAYGMALGAQWTSQCSP